MLPNYGWTLIISILCIAGVAEGAGVDARIWGPRGTHFFGVIIPGFASTRLRAWSLLDCPFSPLDFNPLDPVWLDTRKVLSVPNCWMKCMVLDPYNQTDHPECKSRPDSGIPAITELDPGYITGALSSVWKEWVSWCIEFGIEADTLIAAPYDWRIAGSMLEERDLYFHKLKLTFETCRKHCGGPSVVFAHSMGNNVFRYFLEWLKGEIPPKLYLNWIDDHIYAYHAMGAPLLGSAEILKSMLSGVTFGLPISEGSSRMMGNTFSSSSWMLPFSKDCYVRQEEPMKVASGLSKATRKLTCQNDHTNNGYNWPVDIVTVEMPMVPGISYPGISSEQETIAVANNCSIPMKQSFGAQQISDGTLFREVADFDPHASVLLYQLEKYMHNDPILNPLTPWERPPIKNVFCTYGVNLRTEVGYHFVPSGKPYPDNWILTDIIYETEGGALISRSGAEIEGNTGHTSGESGDGTVPYHSLAWCKEWLGLHVNITRSPQSAHDGSNVQELLNFEHNPGSDIVMNMTRDSRIRYITYYEDAASHPERRTAVWELDKVDHRNLVRSPILLREMWLEMLHGSHPEAKKKFVSKVKREPMRDEDCYWDYAKARCALPDRCEYRYVFGDVHLGQSCRLKASSDKHILHYL